MKTFMPTLSTNFSHNCTCDQFIYRFLAWTELNYTRLTLHFSNKTIFGLTHPVGSGLRCEHTFQIVFSAFVCVAEKIRDTLFKSSRSLVELMTIEGIQWAAHSVCVRISSQNPCPCYAYAYF